MSISDDEFLSAAIGFAARSPLPMHKTGCIITMGDEIVSTGWSHVSDVNYAIYYSTHAELHALHRLPRRRKLSNLKAYIATVSGRVGNRVTFGTPCLQCAKILLNNGIARVHFTISGTTEHFNYEYLNLNEISITSKNFKVYRTPLEDI